MKRFILFLLFFALCAVHGQVSYEYLTCFRTGKQVPHAGTFSSEKVVLPAQYRPATVEMRGVWVATVKNLDFPRHATAAEFQKDFLALLENLCRANFNTLIFQVRPTNDAFYPSKLNPWSQFMTGAEGKALGNFDPLKFMVEETHKRGIEFHAWMNPYRVTNDTPLTKNAYLNSLNSKNFARLNPGLVLDVPVGKTRMLILNPGEPAVVKFISDTVREVITNYDVDAIHFDDYFYPYSPVGNADSATFQRNNPGRLALDEWRRTNVDKAIKSVSDTIRAHNKRTGKSVQFGISPFGIWANQSKHAAGSLTGGSQSYFSQFADSRKWVRSNWIDYIIPQVYWSFDHNTAAYGAVTDWWVSNVRGTNVKLYIGHAAYKLGTGGAWQNHLEIPNQLRYNCKYPEIRGSCFYSYRHIFAPENNIMRNSMSKVTAEYWKYPAKNP